jgi:glycosyltransferase involved in cell wall biosynthesis
MPCRIVLLIASLFTQVFPLYTNQGMAMQQPLVSIVIATYNRASSLRSYSFPAIEKLTYPKYEVIVVDDCSTDDTQDFLQTYQEKMENLSVLRNKSNRGAAFSRNRGAAQAKGEIVVLIDDDVSPFPDCLDEVVKFFQENSDIMAAWGCVYQYGGSWSEGERTFGTGSLWALQRVVFDRFNFDANMRYFGTPACDEHEFARRIQRHGCKIAKIEKAQADHFHGPARNRSWRGVGGDLNHLYEQVKTGSLLKYYGCIVLGAMLALRQALIGSTPNEKIQKYYYKQAIATPYRLLVFFKERRFSLAIKWFYYVLVDIPIRAKITNALESSAQ